MQGCNVRVACRHRSVEAWEHAIHRAPHCRGEGTWRCKGLGFMEMQGVAPLIALALTCTLGEPGGTWGNAGPGVGV